MNDKDDTAVEAPHVEGRTPAGARITRGRLSDGREILWFDDESAADRTGAVDERGLPETHTFSERRKDPLTGEWAVYAAHRQTRTFMPPANEDPLSPTVAGQLPTEVPSDSYDVVVFENRFPSLSMNVQVPNDFTDTVDDEGLVLRQPARARCEVVCFTAAQDGSFRDLPRTRMRTLIDVWAHRTAELSSLDGIQLVFPFENRGEEIGVTLQHPHGQIYSYPYLPPRATAIATQAKQHKAETGRDLFDDILAAEQNSGRRIITATEHFVVFVPAAAKWPVEVMVMPKRHIPDFPDLHEEEREDLADILHQLYPAVDRFFPGVERTPYIAAWNQAPVDREFRPYGRLHLQLFSLMRSPGRMKFLAGSESAMAAWISDTTPETIADTLRKVW